MIRKIIKKDVLDDNSDTTNLAYWLPKSHSERIEAVEILRRQFDGSAEGLQRTLRVIQRARG